MGQKVNPKGLRLGITRTWESLWYDKAEYAKKLHEDLAIRRYIDGKLKNAGVERVTIMRAGKIRVTIYSSRPAIVIGKKGAEVDKLKAVLQKIVGNQAIDLKIVELKSVDTSAQLVAKNIARQLEARAFFRRAMKMAIQNALKAGAEGIRIRCSGRLGGIEMSRTEKYMSGRVPLHTLRADIDYGFAESHTTMGQIGVKVWIFKGEKRRADIRKGDAGLLVKRSRPSAGPDAGEGA